MMTAVRFYDTSFLPETGLTYSVIAAIHRGRWIFVRHRDRITWEIAGGHIEKDESPGEAAERELKEETGADEFRMHPVATYSVEADGKTGYGRLFLAEVKTLKAVPDVFEIAEIMISENMPDKLTYPDIQPLLFKKIIEFAVEKGIIQIYS
jgi:8-oxo-dGTP diphosphatase